MEQKEKDMFNAKKKFESGTAALRTELEDQIQEQKDKVTDLDTKVEEMIADMARIKDEHDTELQALKDSHEAALVEQEKPLAIEAEVQTDIEMEYFDRP